MKKEFNLSEKILTTWYKDFTHGGANNRQKVEDVKEFIRQLKEFVWDRDEDCWKQVGYFFIELDKLAGEELI